MAYRARKSPLAGLTAASVCSAAVRALTAAAAGLLGFKKAHQIYGSVVVIAAVLLTRVLAATVLKDPYLRMRISAVSFLLPCGLRAGLRGWLSAVADAGAVGLLLCYGRRGGRQCLLNSGSGYLMGGF